MAATKHPLKIEQGATFRKSVTWKAGTPAAAVAPAPEATPEA